MVMKVDPVNYYKVMVWDRPGEGARVLSALSRAGANLRAIHAFPASNGRTQLDLVPVGSRFENAARKAKIRHGKPKKAIMVSGDDAKGVAARLLQRLADANVNVTAMTAVRGGKGRFGAILWVKPRDLKAARKALRKH
jgi:hypothetical protein